MNIGIIGAGAWGSALAIIVKKAGHNVILWSYDGTGINDSKFDLSDIQITSNMSDLQKSDAWLIVTPAAYFRDTIKSAKPFWANQPIIICTKGIEDKTHKLMSEILATELPECLNYGVLSGPQFAAEVANGVPTGSLLAGTDSSILNAGRNIFAKLYLEESNDVIGAEICGVGKNALALISGYLSITAVGENERAMLFTRAWGEIVNFGLGQGAKIETFMGLAGLGDLFLSATSPTSRNFAAGVAIARGESIGKKTVEGIFALKGLIKRGKNMTVLQDMYLKMNIDSF